MKHITRLAFIGTLLSAAMLPAADPFNFAAPRNWRPERIPFPLGFAPELTYRGFEELRFGPGMFKPGSDTYWTYGFFWWIEGRQAVIKMSVEKDLLNYYRGLSRAVGGSRGLQIDSAKITVDIQPANAKPPTRVKHPPAYTGTLTTYDAFVTGELLRLRLEVSHRYHEAVDRTWVFFCVAPEKADTGAWKTLRGIRDSFAVK